MGDAPLGFVGGMLEGTRAFKDTGRLTSGVETSYTAEYQDSAADRAYSDTRGAVAPASTGVGVRMSRGCTAATSCSPITAISASAASGGTIQQNSVQGGHQIVDNSRTYNTWENHFHSWGTPAPFTAPHASATAYASAAA